jgi:hypothetical protein
MIKLKTTLFKCALFVTALNMVASGSAFAAPTIDGKFDAGEGYSSVQNINMFDRHGNMIFADPGKLYTHIEGGYLYSLVSISKDYVDNSYGNRTEDNSVGWGSKTHKFDDLVNSDAAIFTLSDSNGNAVMEINMDYLLKTTSTNPSEEYVSDGTVGSGQASWLKGSATSLEYNTKVFNTFLNSETGTDPIGKDMLSPETMGSNSYDVVDALFSDWIFEVNYEFQVDLAALNGAGFGGIGIDYMHASPSKVDARTFVPEPPTNPPVVIPEPSTYLLLGCSLLFTANLKRRKATQVA